MPTMHHVDAADQPSCAQDKGSLGKDERPEHIPLLDCASLFDKPPQAWPADEYLADTAHPSPHRPSMAIPYEHIPTEILGLIESYLPPSDCAHLSATSASLHRRWTARRWQRTFQLHYGRKNQLRARERVADLKRARDKLAKLEANHGHRSLLSKGISRDACTSAANEDTSTAFAKYDACYKEGWEFTFVGCCHEQQDFCSKCNRKYKPGEKDGSTKEELFGSQAQTQSNACHKPSFGREDSFDDMSALTTKFNVTALVPSVRRLYVDLWDTIELSLLGYFDAEETEVAGAQHLFRHPTHHTQFPVPAIMRILRTSVLPELVEYLYFLVAFKPLAVRGIDHGVTAAARRRRRRVSGVMGPMLARGLGGVHFGTEHQHPVGTGPSQPSTTSNNREDANARSLVRCTKNEPSRSQQNNAHLARSTTTLEEINSLRNAATTMSAWKLACILREQGVGCLRCAICDRIDLMGDDSVEDCDGNTRQQNEGEGEGDRARHGGGRSPFLREFQRQVGGGEAWMTPCQCPDLVHRQCLEQKLKLVPKFGPWERMKIRFGRVHQLLCASISGKTDGVGDSYHQAELSSPLADGNPAATTSIAPRVWISYDNPLTVAGEDHAIAVDLMGRFCSSAARCESCGWQFLRTVRLPRTKFEVLAASLSDPIAWMWASSTFIHFILACTFLAACEGLCSDASCDSHRTLLDTKLGVLKWPTTGLNGFALAWWQLQQCCMLHIFFSRRFAAIVDRLWMGPISLFYCRLYFYFILTSALLAASYIPMVTRSIRGHLLEPFISTWLLESMQPVGNAIAFANLVQYAVVSTTVICIFWRTNYRIFTVADGKEAAATLRRREELERNTRGEDGQRRGLHIAVHNVDPMAMNAIPIQRIVGVGAGDNNAANHPIYHGPW